MCQTCSGTCEIYRKKPYLRPCHIVRVTENGVREDKFIPASYVPGGVDACPECCERAEVEYQAMRET